MGNYLATFHDYPEGLMNDKSTTSYAEWILQHSELTKLSVPEVERLWMRFEEMRSDEYGRLSKSDIENATYVKNDIFVKNVLLALCLDDQLYFQTLCNVVAWAKTAPVEDKLNAMFKIFHEGQPIPKDVLSSVISRAYPDKSKAKCDEYASIVIRQLCDTASEEVGPGAWVQFTLDSLPLDELETLLHFSAIPDEVHEQKEEVSSLATIDREVLTSRTAAESDARVAAACLEELARRVAAAGSEWRSLGAQLGCTTEQMAAVTARPPTERVDLQVLEILRAWRVRAGAKASGKSLGAALKNSGMAELVTFIQCE